MAAIPRITSATVSKPEKNGSGRSAVVDYLITTSFEGEGESKTNESLVRRTFDDFQWVQKRLVKERMGIIVPILSKKKPAKNKEQFSEPFINVRKDAIDRFLQRVVNHPELVDAPCLLPFLTANSTDWIATKKASSSGKDKDLLLQENTTNPDEADINALETIHIDAHAAMYDQDQQKKKGPVRRWFANKRTEWALKNDNLDLEETPAEAKKFSDMKTYADHLEVCIRILSEDYKAIQSSNAVLAEKTGTMGAAFAQMWGEHELSNTGSSNLYQRLGQAWSNLSTVIQSHVSFGERYFESPIDELVGDVVALQDALAQRKASLYAYTKLTEEGKVLNKQLDRIRNAGNMTTQQDRYFKLESQLRHCDEKIAETRNHSDLVTTRLERDIERFRVEWHERMRQVLEIFHKQQVSYFQSQAKEFSSVLPDLVTLDTERSELAAEVPEPEKFEINFSVNSGGAKALVVTQDNGQDDGVAPTPIAPDIPSSSLPPSQAISLNASFSSDDGFDSAPAMGGGDTAEVGFGTESEFVNGESLSSKPILKSV